MGEADTRAKLIDPAIHARGWTEDLIRRITDAGRSIVTEVDGRALPVTVKEHPQEGHPHRGAPTDRPGAGDGVGAAPCGRPGAGDGVGAAPCDRPGAGDGVGAARCGRPAAGDGVGAATVARHVGLRGQSQGRPVQQPQDIDVNGLVLTLSLDDHNRDYDDRDRVGDAG